MKGHAGSRLSTLNFQPTILSIFDFLFFYSVYRMLAPFPFLAQAAHRFAQAHCQCGNCFKPLFSAARQCAVILPVNLRQQKLRVPQKFR